MGNGDFKAQITSVHQPEHSTGSDVHLMMAEVVVVVVVVVVEIFIHGAVKATLTNAPQSQLNK